jgi:hypothetical protein
MSAAESAIEKAADAAFKVTNEFSFNDNRNSNNSAFQPVTLPLSSSIVYSGAQAKEAAAAQVRVERGAWVPLACLKSSWIRHTHLPVQRSFGAGRKENLERSKGV